MPVNEALMTAGSRRLRAVFLTSVTTIAGLLPMLSEKSLQAQALIPMATSLAFGLLASTCLVLLVVPFLYKFYAVTTFTKKQMLGLEPIGHGTEVLSANDGGEAGLAQPFYPATST